MLRYVYDGTVQTYNPETIFSESGNHLLGTQAWMNSTGGAVHRWEVFAKTTSGTATIAIGHVHVLLKGQGLASAEGSWDGLIECSDTFEVLDPSTEIVELTDTVDLELQNPEPLTPFTEFTPMDPSSEIVQLTDTVNLFTVIPHDNLITDEGDYLVTEDGDHLVT